MLDTVFTILMFGLVIQGFVCAFKLDSSYKFWLRLVILIPALTAIATLYAYLSDSYAVFLADCLRAGASNLSYVLITGQLAGRNWLTKP